MDLWGHGGSYADWGAFLGRWAVADQPLPDRPPVLDSDDFDGPTWTRLMLRIQDAFNTRLGRWNDALIRELNRADDEFSFGRALMQARTGLSTLAALSAMPELPEAIRELLRSQIDGVIASTQEQLEESAQRDLHGPGASHAEMRLRQLRANPLRSALRGNTDSTAAPAPYFPTPEPTPGGGRRRAIIIDREVHR